MRDEIGRAHLSVPYFFVSTVGIGSNMKILVSSCLIGKKCSYDGKDRLTADVVDFLKGREYVDMCPEVSGGLGCPRDKHEIVDDKIIATFVDDAPFDVGVDAVQAMPALPIK